MLIELAKNLIARASITPKDEGCQILISDFLIELGFQIQSMPFNGVQNLWATYGNEGPLLVFAGHTDVVPPGPSHAWRFDPFTPTIYNQCLYGRGAADMKSAIAAMLVATHNFIKQNPQFPGRLGFLITSDEEGRAINGTRAVVAELKRQNTIIDFCLIGEASSENQLGDIIKIGRRGSLSAELTIFGKQGHIAYPQLANNPIHHTANWLKEFTQMKWDKGGNGFDPTQLQISNIHAGTGANNVIPAELQLQFNFRYAPVNNADTLQKQTHKLLNKHQLDYNCTWHHSGKPFYSPEGKLTNTIKNAIQQICGITPKPSTGGGTSDGRFIIEISNEVVELGPPNATIHQIDEHIHVDDLIQLEKIYQWILTQIFTSNFTQN